MRTCAAFAALTLCFASLASRTAEALPSRFRSRLHEEGLNLTTVNTPAGPITGFSEPTPHGAPVDKFLGIPFAQDTSGANRFRSPQPMAKFETAYDATAFKAACPQPDHSLAPLEPMSEDCLNLNIFCPGGAGQKPEGTYAVMLWLYGGSWSRGDGSFIIYDGAMDAGHFGDVCIVTMNYRLGILGFPASDALRAESADGSAGNYGIEDQRMALQWIQANIGAFGGDPNRVTLFGQSAGAGSTSTHLVLPRSKGLFTRAIAESGPWADWTARTWEVSVNHTSRVAAAINCVGSSDQILACLRQATWKDLMNHRENPHGQIVDWSPIIDGVELTADPQVLGREGKFNKDVDVMLGTNLDEASTFLNMIPKDANETVFREKVRQEIGSLADGVFELYPLSDYKTPWWAAVRAFSEGMFTCPARRMVRYLSEQGAKSARQYFVTWELLVARLGKNLGVFHGDEIAFVFRDEYVITPGPERNLMDAMSTYWTRLAVKGDPNLDPFPFWPTYNTTTDLHMEMNPFSLSPKSGLFERKCDWWDAVLAAGCHPYPLLKTCANPPPVPPAV